MKLDHVVKLMNLFSENGISVEQLEVSSGGTIKVEIFGFDDISLRDKAKQALYDYNRSLCLPDITEEQRIQYLQQLLDEAKVTKVLVE